MSLQTDLLQAFHYLCLEGGQWLKVQLKQRPVWGQASRKLTLMLPLACVCSNSLWHLVFWKTFVYTITCWKRPVAFPFSRFPLLSSYFIFCTLVSTLQFFVIIRAPSILFGYSPFTMHIAQLTVFIFSQLEPLSFIVHLSSAQLMIAQKWDIWKLRVDTTFDLCYFMVAMYTLKSSWSHWTDWFMAPRLKSLCRQSQSLCCSAGQWAVCFLAKFKRKGSLFNTRERSLYLQCKHQFERTVPWGSALGRAVILMVFQRYICMLRNPLGSFLGHMPWKCSESQKEF